MASNRQRLQKIFGFYPEPFQLNAGPVTITPLPEFEQSIADTLASDHIEKDWIYAPPQQTREFGSGEVRDCPYSARVFGLSKTHLIEHTAATGEEHLDFHLWALSFFMGMRLTATEAGFLDATPLKAGNLVDFVLQGSSLTLAVELADDFWRTNHHDPRRARLFAGAVHALFLAQNPRSPQFERITSPNTPLGLTIERRIGGYHVHIFQACLSQQDSVPGVPVTPIKARRMDEMQ